MQPMLFAEFEPPAELSWWVDCLWLFQVAPDAGEVDHWVPPDGGLNLSYSRRLRALRIAGPFLQPMKPPVRAGDEVWGVRFFPGAGSKLLGVDPEPLRNRVLPAAELLEESWVGILMEELGAAAGAKEAFDAFSRLLRSRLAGAREIDPKVQSAVEILVASGGQTPISELAAQVGLSPRQLRRRFRAATGLSPKELARIRRFRASAIEALLAGRAPWAQVAAGHGYADQAHLVREYRKIIGLAPRAFGKQFAQIRHELLAAEPEAAK